MSFSWGMPVFGLGLFASSLLGQASASPATVQRDASALQAINSSLVSAGGEAPVRSVQTVLATGTITYHLDDPLTGAVTVRCQGAERSRMDATLENGIRTAIADKGGEILRDSDGKIYSSREMDVAAGGCLAFPYIPLLSALDDLQVSIIDLGVVTYDGAPFRDIRTEKVPTGPAGRKGALTTRHYLLDPGTYQIVRILDMPEKTRIDHDTPLLIHEVRYSGYQTVSGVLVPLSITEFMHGDKLSTTLFTSVVVNASFTDSDFVLQ